ncbi:MAG TPA: hypothetical protein PLY85_11390, partial [Anaerolineaceae bacterium]|nr:hypothetical protein [Anaerolineaceae bacterium]
VSHYNKNREVNLRMKKKVMVQNHLTFFDIASKAGPTENSGGDEPQDLILARQNRLIFSADIPILKRC